MEKLKQLLDILSTDKMISHYDKNQSCQFCCCFELFTDSTMLKAKVILDTMDFKSKYTSENINFHYTKFKSKSLADDLWMKLKKYYDSVSEFNDLSFVDKDNALKWKATSIYDTFVIEKYNSRGFVYPKYNLHKPHDKNLKGFKSLYIFIDSNNFLFRFLIDPQSQLKHSDRIYDNHLVLADKDEIQTTIQPDLGQCLIFDHLRLHDMIKNNTSGYLITTNIMYSSI